MQTKQRRERQIGRVVGRSADDKDWMVLWQGCSTPVQINFKFLMRAISEEQNVPYVWKVIPESVPQDEEEAQEYSDIGVTQFSFEQFSSASTSKHNPDYGRPYQCLLEKLWHGNWKQQKKQINDRIKIVNLLPSNLRNKNYRKIELISNHGSVLLPLYLE